MSRFVITTCWISVSVILLVSACGRRGSGDRSAGPDKTRTQVYFSDVTEEAGLSEFQHYTGAFGKKWFPETMGSGCGFIDYDGDGWQDVILAAGGVFPETGTPRPLSLRLYRNEQGSRFREVTEQAGLINRGDYTHGVTVADYDNDGDADLFVTTLHHNRLYRNDDGTFKEVGSQAGLSDRDTWSTAGLFFDADRDGHLDLLVGNYVEWSPEKDLFCTVDGVNKAYCTPQLFVGERSRYYHNRGDGTFEERTDEAGFGEGEGNNLGIAEYDFDRDGWPDVFVANDYEPDEVYHNQGDGTFEEIGRISGVAFDAQGRATAGMGIDVGDIDNDGVASVFVGNFSDQMIGVFRYLDHGVFLDRAAASQIGRPSIPTLTFGLFLFDVDLDGDLDLFAANGHVQDDIETTRDNTTYRQPSHLFLNVGGGEFEDIAASANVDEELVARGAAYADYDRDGDLDILLTENGGGARLWRNDSDGAGNYLHVKTVGTASNRMGIGASVIAKVGDRVLGQRIRAGASYLSSSETIATIGLGSASSVDSLIVEWPSGTVDRHAGLEGNRVYVVTEGGRIEAEK